MPHRPEETGLARLINATLSRRQLVKSGGCLGAIAYLSKFPSALAETGAAEDIGFSAIKTSSADAVTLAEGYHYEILLSWGDPISQQAPKFSPAASAEDQAQQFGDNTDGMELFKQASSKDGSVRYVLAINNEYYNHEYLFPHGQPAQTAQDVAKAQNAVGLTLVELERNSSGSWQVALGSSLNRRVLTGTEIEITGPAAGSQWLQTAADPSGKKAWGTLNNCGAGRTPWGTYLTCEENFNNFFGAPKGTEMSQSQKRYGLGPDEDKYSWWPHDPRFDLSKEPNEPNRFGWIVEVDPFNPQATPKKRTALGRFKHENAAVTIAEDGRVVVYMGDDEKGEFIYRFVSSDGYQPGAASNSNLLDRGVLSVARFDENGSGVWLPLIFGQPGLTAEDGFKDQADILIRAREAGTKVGATTMDRPEWVACHPSAPLVFCSLTNNSERGTTDEQPVNGPNPRAKNVFGQIVRWWPARMDHTRDTFEWDLYVIAGNPTTQKGADAGSDNITADNMFNSPDGLKFDGFGRLWIQTDGNYSNQGVFAGQGNNQMLCADPVTGEIRRFMVGPRGCEVTGIAFADDYRSLFIGIQHPTGDWPNAKKDGVPRSSVIAIRKHDGGVIGT